MPTLQEKLQASTIRLFDSRTGNREQRERALKTYLSQATQSIPSYFAAYEALDCSVVEDRGDWVEFRDKVKNRLTDKNMITETFSDPQKTVTQEDFMEIIDRFDGSTLEMGKMVFNAVMDQPNRLYVMPRDVTKLIPANQKALDLGEKFAAALIACHDGRNVNLQKMTNMIKHWDDYHVKIPSKELKVCDFLDFLLYYGYDSWTGVVEGSDSERAGAILELIGALEVYYLGQYENSEQFDEDTYLKKAFTLAFSGRGLSPRDIYKNPTYAASYLREFNISLILALAPEDLREVLRKSVDHAGRPPEGKLLIDPEMKITHITTDEIKSDRNSPFIEAALKIKMQTHQKNLMKAGLHSKWFVLPSGKYAFVIWNTSICPDQEAGIYIKKILFDTLESGTGDALSDLQVDVLIRHLIPEERRVEASILKERVEDLKDGLHVSFHGIPYNGIEILFDLAEEQYLRDMGLKSISFTPGRGFVHVEIPWGNYKLVFNMDREFNIDALENMTAEGRDMIKAIVYHYLSFVKSAGEYFDAALKESHHPPHDLPRTDQENPVKRHGHLKVLSLNARAADLSDKKALEMQREVGIELWELYVANSCFLQVQGNLSILDEINDPKIRGIVIAALKASKIKEERPVWETRKRPVRRGSGEVWVDTPPRMIITNPPDSIPGWPELRRYTDMTTVELQYSSMDAVDNGFFYMITYVKRVDWPEGGDPVKGPVRMRCPGVGIKLHRTIEQN